MWRASEPRLEKDDMSVTFMYCVLCGEDIHPQTDCEYIDTNTKTLKDTRVLTKYTCSVEGLRM